MVPLSTITDQNVSEELAKALEVAELKEQYRMVVQISIKKWITNLQNNSIPLNTVEDFQKLIELDLKLRE
ncbi:hypothetical protein ACOC6V_002779 [Listeria monocytogenes]|uniref:Uncharacterized protein n=3 Tax=Listeria TaxID=1637 RepID=A0A3A7K0H3_LISMN|nr:MULTISPECIES: hypothetical protein [Listeria]EAG6272433.1 hypothetical protein [Listeria monocytogenes CFSAN003726]EAG6284966.1 hypothetical protein [Listeria monocytogenes CFSAN003810]EAG6360555.1 hypothetical protein [Listeria monocytogenes CFSAN003729]EAG6369505.1 hypothetical protein [Listeria monocytogenes CFSAN003728]MCX62505.1 hypothetical protein [Listeria monocytogenes serotype 4b]MCX98352.1 hypothetical protein [Listeria monocytogenes serotype 1/2a]MDA50768.1 hypothetical protei